MPDNGRVPTPADDARTSVARWLADPGSAEIRAAAGAALAAAPRDPLAAAAALRRDRPGLPAELASAALEQADLHALARERYGLDASALLLSRDGLEQATRPALARHRADLIRASGATQVVDLTGGLGFDTAALLSAGLDVTVVERDPATAVLLAHNCPGACVITGDATDPLVLDELLRDLAPADVLFADPARRDPDAARGHDLRARPERDPARWSPPWPVIEALPHPRVAAKVAPSFQPPGGWHAEWASVQRSLVECAVFSWPVFAPARRAVVWSDGSPTIIDADDGPTPATASELGRWLLEPDPAVARAGALPAVLRAWPGLAPVDARSSWLTGGTPAIGAPLRGYAVIATLDGSATAQRRQLDRLGVSGLTVKSRDVPTAPRTILRELGRPEGADHVLVVTRHAGRTVRVLCEPTASRAG